MVIKYDNGFITKTSHQDDIVSFIKGNELLSLMIDIKGDIEEQLKELEEQTGFFEVML